MNHVLLSKRPSFFEKKGISQKDWRAVVAKFMTQGNEFEVDPNTTLFDDCLLILAEGALVVSWEFEDKPGIPLGIISEPIIFHPLDHAKKGIKFRSFGGKAKLLSITPETISENMLCRKSISESLSAYIKDQYILKHAESLHSKAEQRVLDALEALHKVFSIDDVSHLTFRLSDLADVTGISRRHGVRVVSSFINNGYLKKQEKTHGWIFKSPG